MARQAQLGSPFIGEANLNPLQLADFSQSSVLYRWGQFGKFPKHHFLKLNSQLRQAFQVGLCSKCSGAWGGVRTPSLSVLTSSPYCPSSCNYLHPANLDSQTPKPGRNTCGRICGLLRHSEVDAPCGIRTWHPETLRHQGYQQQWLES